MSKTRWSPGARPAARDVCHDCGVLEGQIHKDGCDMERCPFCGKQLITCWCKYRLNGYAEERDWQHPTMGLPHDVYKNGLPKEEEAKWLMLLNQRGRVPYILFPPLCDRCGRPWSIDWMTSDEEWSVIPEIYRENIAVCKRCFKTIKGFLDKGKNQEYSKEQP